MAGCRDVKQWIEQNVQQTVEQLVEQLVETCDEVREWIEEQIEQRIEQWEEQSQSVCSSWPWPLNWVCNVVTTLVLVVIMIQVVVGKWLIYAACKTITRLTTVIVQIVVRVAKCIIVAVCALFSDPLLLVNTILDLWTSALDAVEEYVGGLVGDATTIVTGMLDDGADILGDVADLVWTFVTLGLLPWGGPVLRGVINGVVGVLRGMVEGISSILKGQLDVLFGLLTLNVTKFLRGLSEIVAGAVEIGLAGARGISGGWIVGGVRDGVDIIGLRNCISDLVESEIRSSERQNAIRTAIGLGPTAWRAGSSFREVRVPWSIHVRRIYVDSRSSSLDLASLHPAVIDLYDTVGAIGTFSVDVNRPRNEAVIVGTGQRPTRGDIDRFLGGFRNRAPHFRIYAMSKALLREKLEVANRKGRQLGLDFTWTITDQEALKRPDPARNRIDLQVSFANIDRFLKEALGRTPTTPSQTCMVAVGATLQDDPADRPLYGVTQPFPESSGLAFRDAWPDTIFRYVLIHEIGHYFSLLHCGHPGPEFIMWTIKGDKKCTPPMPAWSFSWATLGEAYLAGEPRFTVQDACDVWRFILRNAANCIVR